MTMLENAPAAATTTRPPVGLTDDGHGTVYAAPTTLPGMGASLSQEPRGCTFRVWAPNAAEVFVAGDFTDPQWDDGKVRLQRDSLWGGSADYWSAFVVGVGDGARYRFVIRPNGGGELAWKMDPYCRDATSSNGDSIVRDPSFNWKANTFRMPPWNELVVYELHVGTFNNDRESGTGNFADLIDELDYLRDLGVNAVEVMPAADFDTPTSMGYNPSLLFALEDAFGDPSALRKFIDAAHARGIAVIFDVVYNHFGPQGLDQCLKRFDGWPADASNDGIYFYIDKRAETDFGTRPDFGRSEVRQFIRDNAMMWLHDYRADGLRLDSTVNIRRTKWGDNAEGWGLMQRINNDKDEKQAWKITIAEDLQNNEWLTKGVGAGGAGCNSQWDSSFFGAMKDVLTQRYDEPRDMERVRNAIYNRYNGDAFQRVIYTESHDEVTRQNGQDLGRFPEKIWWGHADSWAARKRSTLGAAMVFTSPGIPMIFMGQEFLEWGTWRDTEPLDWSKEQRFAGILNLYRDLIKLRRNWNNNTRGLRGQHVNVFHVNYEAKLIAFHRWSDGGPGDDVVVVANFADRRYDSYNVGFPSPGAWYLRFNSDWQGYAGDFGNAGYDTTADGAPNQGMPHSGNVGIGPYSAIILSQ
jgi:1,4-alpha-glucan branching enzyme